jgi:LemA protein
MSGNAIAWTVVAVLLACWALGAHNRLVSLRGAVLAAWSQLEQAITRRERALAQIGPLLRTPLAGEHEALDTLVGVLAQVRASAAAVRGKPFVDSAIGVYAAYELDLVEAWAHVAALIDQAPLNADGRALRGRLHAELVELDLAAEALAAAKQWFNLNAAAYDAALRQVPTRLLKPWFGFQAAGRL